MKFLFFLLISASAAFSETEELMPSDYDPKDDAVSEKYEAGAHLIFDCEEGHWACVLAEYSVECDDKREAAIKKGEAFLPCAHLGKLPSKRSCFQKSLYLTGQAHGTRFCLLDSRKKEVIP